MPFGFQWTAWGERPDSTFAIDHKSKGDTPYSAPACSKQKAEARAGNERRRTRATIILFIISNSGGGNRLGLDIYEDFTNSSQNWRGMISF